MEQSTTRLNLALSMQNIKAWWSGTQPNVPCLYFSTINQSTKIFNALTYLYMLKKPLHFSFLSVYSGNLSFFLSFFSLLTT